MLHARSDYNLRIQDSENIIPADEPVFLIRSKDIVSAKAVEVWADLAEKAGASEHIIAAARRQAELMRDYQTKHAESVKVPDMDKTLLVVGISKQRISMMNCKACDGDFEYNGEPSECPYCGTKFNGWYSFLGFKEND
mgnify:CR=1 FL=1